MPDINKKLKDAEEIHALLSEHVVALESAAEQVYDTAHDVVESAKVAKNVRKIGIFANFYILFKQIYCQNSIFFCQISLA